MIVVLSLNPSLDKAAHMDRFFPDRPNRIRVERTDLGGKGVNVARALNALGEKALLTGFDFPGGPVAAGLDDAGVDHRLIRIPGQLRVNLKLREEETGRTIEINETGAEAAPEAFRAVREELTVRCPPGAWAVLCGSLPPGAPEDTYARLCAALKSRGCRVAVDCDGAALRLACEAGPDLIKPNAQEFLSLTGADAADEAAAENACRRLMARGVGRVCLSMGKGGARLYAPSGTHFCPAAPVTPLGVSGAGDTLLAGLLAAFARGCGDENALRFASAAAGASVMRPGTLLCRAEDVDRLLKTLQREG